MSNQQSVDLFNRAVQLAQDGHYASAATTYPLAAAELEANRSSEGFDRLQVMRSIHFNLAQALNHLGQFNEALASVDAGLELNPTPRGRAIGLAAKGEALCG